MEIIEKYLGEKIWIEVIDETGEKVGPTYISEILSYKGAGSIVIGAPRFDKYTIPFPEKTCIRIMFKNMPREKFSLTGIITGKNIFKNMTMLQIKIYNDIDINKQKSMYFCINARLKCNYKILNKDVETLELDSIDSEYTQGITRNISGGGLCLVVKDDIDINKALELVLWIDKNKSIKVIGDITNIYKFGNSYNSKYELNLSFRKILVRDQDSIIKFIFSQEKLVLKKYYA